ncbi:hypothetical protein [Mucilaginibacter arboris]|uniref:Uncharacterized protein n=1 Tax=Mucilaginibacter arboris TaxID=2682090 RepID=A0A7K1SZA7_9SPHI|nr:hypothetical protein [Mucilaginibacter arboris]MVN22380.1 hypothetical protein [Mucilaginibacter arboris]
MQPAVKKSPLLFVTWQHLHILTQQCETTCRLELSRYCSKYGVERLHIYQLCEEYHLTREQLYFHLNM